jgi:hypothetical protein
MRKSMKLFSLVALVDSISAEAKNSGSASFFPLDNDDERNLKVGIAQRMLKIDVYRPSTFICVE